MSKPLIAGAAALAAFAGLPRDPGQGHIPGQIYSVANDSRFTETYFSEPLTTYAVGWRDPENIEETLNRIAPEVQVARRFAFKKATNAEEFLSETVDDVRAIGADFKRVEYTGTEVQAKTQNKGLMVVVDLDNVQAGTPWEQQYVARLLRRLLRNELRRAIAGLSAAATNTNKTWNSSADPDQDVSGDLITAANASGIRPNRVLYGDTSWNTRRTSYRAQNNAGGYASASLTPDELAQYLNVDRVIVSRERYQSGASAKTEVVANKVLMYYADDMAGTEDPSNIKRFVTLHSAEQGGGRVRVYRHQLSSKLVAITVEHYSQIVVTSTLGIRQFTVS